MEQSLQINTTITHYRVLSRIGAGGMGEVYLGQDTKLDRRVALKTLPVGVAGDLQRMTRFIHEAKAAAALSHPNIAHIYEVGEADGTHFIAMEYIDGETLRHQMRKTPMTPGDALDVATQVASALSAAHDAGIVHRDIKPENIMLRSRDGFVKVLDFGLAKLTEQQTGTTDTEALTRAMVNTDAGTVMGTAAYMSPEQAKGTNVDARTDLWSLGAVLYEMIAGHVPFGGETPTETISLILQKDAPPLTRYTPDVPGELERIVTKTLTKDREARYQTAKDLLIDLRNLKRKLEVDAEIDRTMPPEFRSTSTSGGQSASATASGGALATAPARATPLTSGAEYIVSAIKEHWLAAGVAVFVLVAGSIAFSAYLHARNTQATVDSVVVLPFENRSADAETEYLSDGLAESLIYRLSQLPNLKVSPTSVAFHYKGKQVDAVRIGKELGVNAVILGRITQRGDNLTISAEMVDVRDNKLLWGEQYERKMSDLLATQREIAHEIVEKLRLKVSGEEKGLAKHYTESNQAYQLYLRGRFYWNKRTAESLKKSIEYFNQAIERDPSYALAYAGLADAYVLLPTYSAGSPRESYPKAKAAAKRALEMDETLAEAHTSLAYALILFDWNSAESSREFQRAIELNPNYPTARHWHSIALRVAGKLDESIEEMKRAQELDPLSLIINADLGTAYIFARQYDKAIQQLHKTIEMDESFFYAHWRLGMAYSMEGLFQNAVAEYQKARELNDDPSVVASLGQALAASGRRDGVLETLGQLKEFAKKRYVSAYSFALVYEALGEKDQAFEWLERSYQDRAFDLIFLRVDPLLDNFRSDPRFADLVRRVGLPQ